MTNPWGSSLPPVPGQTPEMSQPTMPSSSVSHYQMMPGSAPATHLYQSDETYTGWQTQPYTTRHNVAPNRVKKTAGIWVSSLLLHLLGLIAVNLGLYWVMSSFRPIQSLLYGAPWLDKLSGMLFIIGTGVVFAGFVFGILALIKGHKRAISALNLVAMVIISPVITLGTVTAGFDVVTQNLRADAQDMTYNISADQAIELYDVLYSWGLVSSKEELKEQYGVDLDALGSTADQLLGNNTERKAS